MLKQISIFKALILNMFHGIKSCSDVEHDKTWLNHM